MAAQPTVLYLDPDDELVLALKRAARDQQLILVKTGNDVIEIGDVSTYAVERDEEHDKPSPSGTRSDDADETPKAADPLLNILGIFSSDDPGNDVAQDKYKYLADAYEPDHT